MLFFLLFLDIGPSRLSWSGKGRTERLDLSHVHDRHLKGASDKNEHGETSTFGNKNMGKG
jgi:hypothetical protein